MKALFGRTDTPLTPREAGESDSVGEIDKLDIRPYADGLYRFVRSCNTPMTIGLQGEWGSGKTSLMRLVHGKLKGKDRQAVCTFNFETWQYGAVGNAELLGMLLMRDLADALIRVIGDDDYVYKVRNSLSSFFERAVPVVAGAAVGRITGSDAAGAGTADAIRAGGDGRSDMRKAFAELVQTAVAKLGGGSASNDNARVIVFIDDLDRIRPRLAVRLLEVLKNFMDVESCVFIVACDYEVVREGVRDLMNITAKDKVDAFFHKVFQVQFHMPVGAYSIDKMFREYLEERLELGNPRLKLAKRKIRDFLGSTHLAASNDGSSEGWLRALQSAIETAIGTNPRAVKRFFNLVDLTCCVDEAFSDRGAEAPKRAGSKPAAKGALAHWNVSDHDNQMRTLRWCTALFPIVAMTQRWPEIAAYMLSNAIDRVVGGGGESPGITEFERRLRTMTGDWTGLGDTDEQSSELSDRAADLEDEALHHAISEAYDIDVATLSSSPTVRDFETFCRLWFDVLNNTTDRHRLTDTELLYIAQWTQRMGQMGTSRVRPTNLAQFHRLCNAASPSAGDGFVGFSSKVVGLLKREGLENLKALVKTEAVYVECQVGRRKRQALSFYPKGRQLIVRINATTSTAANWNIPALADAGDRLIGRLQEIGCGADEIKTETLAHSWNFAASHEPDRVAELLPLFGEFVATVNRLAPLADHVEAPAEAAPLRDDAGGDGAGTAISAAPQ